MSSSETLLPARRSHEAIRYKAEAGAVLDSKVLTLGPLEIVTALDRRLSGKRAERSAESSEIIEIADHLLEITALNNFVETAPVLLKACVFIFGIGRSSHAIEMGRRIAALATQSGNIQIERKIYNALGGQYIDIADFTSAMQCLQTALSLAKIIGDQFAQAACLANVATLMQEMGHYRQAIALAKEVLDLDNDSDRARGLKAQCSSTGLFSAHRIGDADSARHFLESGQLHLSFAFGDIGRAFFEKDRALYLIDVGRGREAAAFVDSALTNIGDLSNSRVQTLLNISKALCDWSLGEKAFARQSLIGMYEKSKRSKLYHNLVLQALVKTYSDAITNHEAGEGLGFARELVEYTTSVKKAKFYRQLESRRVERSDQGAHTRSSVDPFATAKDWLTATDVKGPLDDGVPGERGELAKHEELTAIHEDMAKLRAMSIRRDIRTDAVDTAENWAIAAEFFDDETGQHCYRVGHLASMLAREIGLDETFCIQVEHAARLHDIGKIAVNELILLKPGPLDAAEMAAMRLHTEVGAQILSGSDDPTLRMATEVARHHHEWWNGAGYPTKRSGKDIPISARVCAYADVYDALTHMRAYKKAWTHERALEEIGRLKGVQFDPDLFEPFVAVLDRYRADLDARTIPGFADMDSNALIASRRKLMETISGGTK